MRQIPGTFDRALQGIRHLHDAGVPFQINVTLTKQNAHQLEDVYELAKSLGAVAVHIFMLVPVGCGQVLAETTCSAPTVRTDHAGHTLKAGEIQIVTAPALREDQTASGPNHAFALLRNPQSTIRILRRAALQASACSLSAIGATCTPAAICR
jgi:poly-gamma-glutamate capsule biosynthesis protein CapA/YwtB (metallophosphatase superfamily)